MKETAVQVNQRKIQNGIRKQREVIEREQQKVWDKLKDTSTKLKIRTLSADWKIEEAQDIHAMHGLDMEQEIIDSLIKDITSGGWDE